MPVYEYKYGKAKKLEVL